ncbi:hypothetical protein C1N27_03000 [Vibrio diazotrophicus]|nr:hypothetical protein C1N27_03000 [Vibrio diazotrophicus]
MFRLCGSNFTPESSSFSTISPVALSIKWLNLPNPLTFNDVFVEFFGVASLMMKVVRDQIRLSLVIVGFTVICFG